MQHAERKQPGCRFFGKHCRTVVGHEGAWQATTLKRLTQPMDQTACGLVEKPLRVTDDARAVIEYAQQLLRFVNSANRVQRCC